MDRAEFLVFLGALELRSTYCITQVNPFHVVKTFHLLLTPLFTLRYSCGAIAQSPHPVPVQDVTYGGPVVPEQHLTSKSGQLF